MPSRKASSPKNTISGTIVMPRAFACSSGISQVLSVRMRTAMSYLHLTLHGAPSYWRKYTMLSLRSRDLLFCREDVGIIGLPTVDDLYLNVRILGFNTLRCFLCLLRGDIFPVVERQNLVAVDVHALQHVTDNIFDVLPCDGEIAIDQANEITFAHMDASNLHRAYGGGDWRRPCARRGFHWPDQWQSHRSEEHTSEIPA